MHDVWVLLGGTDNTPKVRRLKDDPEASAGDRTAAREIKVNFIVVGGCFCDNNMRCAVARWMGSRHQGRGASFQL
jgi:hypothetical protein